jgi:hypothetical protein
MTCGEVTDFCGPHLGACTTNGCPDSPSVVGGLFNGDQCISISVPNHKIEKGMARELAGSSQVCVQGTPSNDQTLSVSYACLK